MLYYPILYHKLHYIFPSSQDEPSARRRKRITYET